MTFTPQLLQVALAAVYDAFDGDLTAAYDDPTTVPDCTEPEHQWTYPVDASSECVHCHYRLTMTG